MTIFTIDEQNDITAFGSAEEAAAGNATPFDSFSSQKELAGLVTSWPAERLIAIWNCLPGVEPVKKFKNAKIAAKWMFNGKLVSEDSQTISPTGGMTATEFHITKKTAWPKGKYTVDVSLNGVSAGTKDLEVK